MSYDNWKATEPDWDDYAEWEEEQRELERELDADRRFHRPELYPPESAKEWARDHIKSIRKADEVSDNELLEDID